MEQPFCKIIKQDVQLFSRPQRVGILGGTFNPPHSGHVDMCRHVKDEFVLDRVCMMPCGNPPHKEHGLASKQKRLQMTRLCAEGSGIEVIDTEVKREGYSYTADTIAALREKNPQTDYYFIIGADTVFELLTWHEYKRLFELAKIICVRRQNNDVLKLMAEIAKLKCEYGAQMFLSEYTGLFVSSSYIRKCVAQGRNIGGLVPARVEEYIIANGLYRKP
ncbi:MAG: nicotinate-nucleotide adenylyltransferase [Christensenella sp.]